MPKGCDRCRGTGFLGRIGVFEVEINNEGLVLAVEHGAPEDHIRQLLSTQGGTTLAQDALAKVADGITSLEEVERMSWVDFSKTDHV